MELYGTEEFLNVVFPPYSRWCMVNVYGANGVWYVPIRTPWSSRDSACSTAASALHFLPVLTATPTPRDFRVAGFSELQYLPCKQDFELLLNGFQREPQFAGVSMNCDAA